MRFLGFTAASATPSPAALSGESVSMWPIHLGISASAPGAGRLRHWRLASSKKPAPSAIFPHETESDAVELVATLPSCASTYTTVLTAASATTHPRRNAGPFTLARAENSMRMTAMIGTGLIATAMANVRTSLIP